MNKYKTRILRNVLSSILVVLIFCCAFVTIVNLSFYWFYIETNVKGFSMRPTINTNVTKIDEKGDKIFINQYQIGEVNDIIVADVDWPEVDGYVIKRLVGTPGDKIEIKDHGTYYTLYNNDNELYSKEKKGENSVFTKTETVGYFAYYNEFLKNPENAEHIETDGNSTYIRLKENEYFVMGDNWGHTLDSIYEGPIKKGDIIGKVELIIDVNNKNPFTAFNFFIKKIFSKN